MYVKGYRLESDTLIVHTIQGMLRLQALGPGITRVVQWHVNLTRSRSPRAAC